MTSLTNNAMSAFTKGFTDAITGAEKFSDAMKTMAKSVIDSLIEMLVQYYITQQIFGAITSMFPTGGGGTSTAPNTNMGAILALVALTVAVLPEWVRDLGRRRQRRLPCHSPPK